MRLARTKPTHVHASQGDAHGIQSFRVCQMQQLKRKSAVQTKIEAVREELARMLARDPAAKALVFSQFTSMLDLVAFRLEQVGLGSALRPFAHVHAGPGRLPPGAGGLGCALRPFVHVHAGPARLPPGAGGLGTALRFSALSRNWLSFHHSAAVSPKSGHPGEYVPADPLSLPVPTVPKWYFLSVSTCFSRIIFPQTSCIATHHRRACSKHIAFACHWHGPEVLGTPCVLA